MPLFAFHSEFIQNHVADVFAISQRIIGSFYFFMCTLVDQEIALECGHLALVEGWRVFSAPEIPDVIEGKGFFIIVLVGEIGGTDKLSRAVQQFLAFVFPTQNFHFFQCSVFVQWHGGMEQQVRVADIEHTAIAEQTFHVFPQFFAPGK